MIVNNVKFVYTSLSIEFIGILITLLCTVDITVCAIAGQSQATSVRN